jgi:UDP:flavonoid glycosyltransferase YjiC (YdhE family)
MRFLMSFAGGYGHAAPLFPLAQALLSRGHEVAFTGQSSSLAAVNAAGFKTFESGGTIIVQAAAHSKFQPFDESQLKERMRRNFGDKVARERLIGVMYVAKHWPPDIIVCDEVDFGAMLAAETLQIRHVTMLVIASGRIVTPDWFAETVDNIRIDNHLPSDPHLKMIGRNLVLSPFPPKLRSSNAIEYSDIAYIRGDTQTTVQHDFLIGPTPRRPRIYATFGTEFNTLATDLFATLLRSLAMLDADIVAAVGNNVDPAILGPQPENVDLRSFVDQADLLPSCSLMVSHGGSGSFLASLAHGLPMLILPLGADQPFNAESGCELGFAIALDPMLATPTSIVSSASTLLQSTKYRAAANLLQSDIARQQPVSDVISRLEELAKETGSGKIQIT